MIQKNDNSDKYHRHQILITVIAALWVVQCLDLILWTNFYKWIVKEH
jgi:hypothetical protein